jgi:hypothetical protein
MLRNQFRAYTTRLSKVTINIKISSAIKEKVISSISKIKTTIIYAIWRPVVSLPKIFGKGVSDSIKVICTAAPKRIATSLPINITNIYKGIYELSHRKKIVPDNKSLSATGSKIVPR